MCGSPLSQYPGMAADGHRLDRRPVVDRLVEEPLVDLALELGEQEADARLEGRGQVGCHGPDERDLAAGQVVDIGRVGWPDRRVVRPAHVEAGPGVEVGQLDPLAETHRGAGRAERG